MSINKVILWLLIFAAVGMVGVALTMPHPVDADEMAFVCYRDGRVVEHAPAERVVMRIHQPTGREEWTVHGPEGRRVHYAGPDEVCGPEWAHAHAVD